MNVVFFFVKQKTAYDVRISDWSSYVCSSDLAAENAQRVDAIERLRSCRDLHHGKRASLRRAKPLIGERQMVDLRLHDAGDLAMTLGAAPDLAFGPERMLAQFFDRRMIVIGDQVGEREVRRIEAARLAAEQLEPACGLLDHEHRNRATPQCSINQETTRHRLEGRS